MHRGCVFTHSLWHNVGQAPLDFCSCGCIPKPVCPRVRRICYCSHLHFAFGSQMRGDIGLLFFVQMFSECLRTGQHRLCITNSVLICCMPGKFWRCNVLPMRRGSSRLLAALNVETAGTLIVGLPPLQAGCRAAVLPCQNCKLTLARYPSFAW